MRVVLAVPLAFLLLRAAAEHAYAAKAAFVVVAPPLAAARTSAAASHAVATMRDAKVAVFRIGVPASSFSALFAANSPTGTEVAGGHVETATCSSVLRSFYEEVDAESAAELTEIYLPSASVSSTRHPPGSLLPHHLDAALPLCLHWARSSQRAADNAHAPSSSSARAEGEGGVEREEEDWRSLHPAEVIERIVARLEAERAAGCSEKRVPWRNLYAVAIDAWAKSGRPDAADRARAVLDSLIPPASVDPSEDNGASADGGGDEEGAGASSSDVPVTVAPEAADHAPSVAGGSNRNPWASPNTVIHNAVLNAYAKRAGGGDQNAARRAEGLLRRMERIYEDRRGVSGLEDIQEEEDSADNEGEDEDEYENLLPLLSKDRSVIPNTISYTCVIDAYAQSSSLPSSASDAERIFRRMEAAYAGGNSAARPNTLSFNTVINAWCQTHSGRGAQRAEEILKRMIELSGLEEGGGELEDWGERNVGPTVVSFTTVMNGWAKSGESGCADRVMSIYRLMMDLNKSGKCSALPNAFTYSTLTDALCKAGRAAEAKEIWSEMVNAYESATSAGNFTSVAKGVKGSGVPAVPNAIQLTQILTTMSKSGDGSSGFEAESLLDQLEGLHSKYGKPIMCPNTLTYTSVINCHAKSRSFGKASKAAAILARMKKRAQEGSDPGGSGTDCRPNVAAFTAVLNACAFSVGDSLEKKEALKIAAATFKELCSNPDDYGRPNQFTYATMLRACANLIPVGSARGASMKSVFNRCKEEGFVDDLVLKVMRSGLDYEEVQEALNLTDVPVGSGRISIDQIPKKWRQNANTGRHRWQRGRGVPKKGAKRRASSRS